jgi:hypothetical protein
MYVLGCDMLNLVLRNGSIGPWRADIDGGGCVMWGNDAAIIAQADWLINMGRVCSMLGLIMGCILTFFAIFKQCLCPLPCSQCILDLSGLGLQISLALVWPMIRSTVCDEYGCRWGSGATALLLAQIFFLAAGCFTRCMREPRYERRKKERKEEEKKKAAAEEEHA